MSRFRQTPQRPVVLLLGWLGSKERYFKHYQRLWQDQGATVIPHQPSILQTAVPGAADRRLLRLMSDFNYRYSTACTVAGAAPPVMVHAMSNAGFVAFGTMLHLVGLLQQAEPGELAGRLDSGMGVAALGGAPAGSGLGGRGGAGWHHFLEDPPALAVLSAFRQVLNNTQGIVINSAPSQATAHIWSRGLLAAVLSEPAHGIEEAHPVLLPAARRLAERYFGLTGVVQRIREVRHAWQYNVPPCPQLYLYSKADALIPWQHIELFMEQQAAHGVPVSHHCWADSGHCEHYRKHPEQYRSLVRSFTEHCLHSHTPPETWI